MDSKQKAHTTIRKALEFRIRAAMEIEHNELPAMSIVEMIDLLYCLWGQTNSLGNYSGAVNSMRMLIGDDLMIERPTPQPEPVGLVQ